jgi:C4-dicarboxylate-specific signal transduction histidine kinase
LKDEQKLLRGMASSGIVVASFSHDLSKISQNLTSRIDKVKKIISLSLSENDFIEIEDRKNPFYLLEKMKKQDAKLQNWLHFSIGIARKDKRQRKKLNFKSYLSNLKDEWQTIFNNRAINLLNKVDQSSIRVFEIDMDSIFNNLIINSINAFNFSKINEQREIKIKVVENQKEIIISYYDNGPGLSKDITDHNKIFKPMFTTNVNKHTGDEEGTGLGMWIIESIVKDNDGKAELIYPDNGGFGLRMLFPKKYTKEE